METFKTLAETIAAADFKARCLELVQQVYKTHAEFVVTRHGKPMARLVPIEATGAGGAASVFGCMAGSAVIAGDIVAPGVADYDMEHGAIDPPARRRKR